jgi:hypothetical protein
VPHKLTSCKSSSALQNALHTRGRQIPVLHRHGTVNCSSLRRSTIFVSPLS